MKNAFWGFVFDDDFAFKCFSSRIITMDCKKITQEDRGR